MRLHATIRPKIFILLFASSPFFPFSFYSRYYFFRRTLEFVSVFARTLLKKLIRDDLLAWLNKIFFGRIYKMIKCFVYIRVRYVCILVFLFFTRHKMFLSSAPTDKFNYCILFFPSFSSCIELYKFSLSTRKIRSITKVYRIKTMPSSRSRFSLSSFSLSLSPSHPLSLFFISSYSFFFYKGISSSIKPTFNTYSPR